jgi:hypothetical protein
MFNRYKRTLIGLFVMGCLSAMVYGLILKETDPTLGNSYVGFGTLFLFLIAMPVFIFSEAKGKKIHDYMLTEENIKKMQGKSKNKTKKEDKDSKIVENL